MSSHRERFPFLARDPLRGTASLAPLLPMQLRLDQRVESILGLIDSGAAVNVIPWSIGVRLGGDWRKAAPVFLSGNLANSEARVLLCEGTIARFAPKQFAFAWSASDHVPVLLGQINFLLSFDVLLSRSGGWFEIAEP